MIKRDALMQSGKPTIRYSGEAAQLVGIEAVKNLIESLNEERYGIPISVSVDQVKSGSLFNSTVEDCIVITHKEHISDYFKYCLLIQKQGRMAYISIYYYGISILTGKARQSEARKGSLGGMLMNTIAGVDQAAYDAEYQYYDMLDVLIEEAVG